MNLSAPLQSTLVEVATIMMPARYDWWIIASAALALHGAGIDDVRDVDVLIDPRDVDAVMTPLGLAPVRGSGDGRFRSDTFVTWTGATLPVELFAGFELFDGARWNRVLPSSRQPITVGNGTLWVPSRAELHAILLSFGREKDLRRAALISPSGRFPSR